MVSVISFYQDLQQQLALRAHVESTIKVICVASGESLGLFLKFDASEMPVYWSVH